MSASNIVVMVIGIPAVILPWAWVVYRVWRACVVLTSTSSAADTVVVQGWLADRRIPVDQIMEVRATHYGPEIRTIDGREIVFVPLSPPWHDGTQYEVVETLSRSARAAHAAHPEETAAAVQANAALRARRERRRTLVWSVIGLGMMVLGLTAPRRWHVIPLAGIGGLLLLVSLGVLYLEMRVAKGNHSRHQPTPRASD